MQLFDFERRVHQYQDRVFSFACYLLGSRDDARDVTQDVLIRLWRAGAGLDEDRVLQWLMRVTRNACIDVLRHRKTVNAVVVAGADADDVPYSDDSPMDRVVTADQTQLIESALEKLPEPHRSIVILREIQDLKYDEISAALEMPLNTVKVYLHRGRKMLREQLSEVLERERV